MQLVNLCPKCNQPMSLYNIPWCPRCDKPTIIMVPTLNFIQALEYIEAQGHPGFKNRVWKYMNDYISNDTSTWLYFIKESERDEYGDGVYEDLKLIKDVFNIATDGIMVEVSW